MEFIVICCLVCNQLSTIFIIKYSKKQYICIMDIFKKIKRIRTEKKISQQDVADILGITQAAYAKIENPNNPESRKISIEYGKGIARALGVSFNELFEIESPANIEEMQVEIKRLKTEISSLKEQLSDKKMIIEFLSSSDILVEVAAALRRKENPERIVKRDFNDVEGLLKEVEGLPYDPGNKESLINYIRPRLKRI
ncbi:DNA-binding transcriptional regulator, XRE-family HTH domain [Mariniphaga anaerophila]|uniref:DNA-binding transcriptional regulator, XRE-family HTH domain n=1 Tax=Mariniphaga anaerophila TaxID=1484053 RepID=A0A1M5CF94_9BACT|nr:helix-turn-helix transcriptional regulator [Mariniphaga anaerophila]SHF53092.1 DNA-binding transcriptional regulator, XRE-family HTH domain [Mariniphaga anaerophila]